MENSEWNSVLIGIVSSLIASLIFYLAVPLFKKLSKNIITYFERTNINYRNNLIKKAAKRRTSHLSDICMISIIVGALTCGIAMIVGEGVDIQTPLMTGLSEKIFTYSVMILFLFYFFFRFMTREDIIDKIQEFEHNLILLKPIIPMKDISELNSQWATMESGEDYQNLNQKIEALLSQKKEKKHDD